MLRVLTEKTTEFFLYWAKQSINNVVHAGHLCVFTEYKFYFNTKIKINFLKIMYVAQVTKNGSLSFIPHNKSTNKPK